MKKFIFFAAAVIVMASCTNKIEPTSSNKSEKEITFSSPVIKPSTKAVINGTTYDTEAGNFGVFSVWTSSDLANASDWVLTGDPAPAKLFMNNVDVAYQANLVSGPDAGGWKATGETKYYWPSEGKLSFLAYSPYMETNVEVGSTVPNIGKLIFTNYTVNMAEEPVDLLYSELVKNKTANERVNGYYGVDIPFHHALSQITFNAKTADDFTKEGVNKAEIKIKSIKLSAMTKATGTQQTDNTISWGTATENAQSYEIVKTFVDGGTVITKDALSAEAVTATFKELLAMPQNFTSNEGAVIDVEYTVNFVNLSGTPKAKTAQFKLNDLTYSDGETAFSPNKKYLFTIIIDLEQVYFAPVIEADWDNVDITADAETVYVN